ncbi:unnamed protein product [marine sediment metagenome]|uniref:Uncharacterized protein n=1 Tax=marine sediment metagenome TaxID=412755 RepID=X1A1H9_9ZZZZ
MSLIFCYHCHHPSHIRARSLQADRLGIKPLECPECHKHPAGADAGESPRLNISGRR